MENKYSYAGLDSHSCNFVYIELWEIFYLWILFTNPTAHFSSGIVVWPTSSVPWCSARHTTRLGFPVPLETAPIGIRFFPCPPIIERHLNVEDVTSWPYSDFIDAWLPLPNTKRIDWNNVMPKMQIYFLCFILVSCIFCNFLSLIYCDIIFFFPLEHHYPPPENDYSAPNWKLFKWFLFPSFFICFLYCFGSFQQHQRFFFSHCRVIINLFSWEGKYRVCS